MIAGNPNLSRTSGRGWCVVVLVGLSLLLQSCSKPTENKTASDSKSVTGSESNEAPEEVNTSREIIVSKETTYLVEPLTDDGRVDYVAAMNARMSDGVTPENNAVVLYWQIIGAADLPDGFRDEYFERLGVPAPPLDGEYFESWDEFVARLHPDLKDDALYEVLDRQTRCQTRPWTADDYPMLAQWLAENERFLDLAVQASRRSEFYSPLTGDGVIKRRPKEFSLVNGCRMFASRALPNRAMLQLEKGDVKAAWEDISAVRRIARQFLAAGPLVDGVVGLGMEGVALDTAVGVAHFGGLDAMQASLIQRDLDRDSAISLRSELHDLFSRCETLCWVMRRIDNPKIEELDFNREGFAVCFGTQQPVAWNEVLRVTNAHIDESRSLWDAADYEKSRIEMEKFDKRLELLEGRVEEDDLTEFWNFVEPESLRGVIDKAESPTDRARLIAAVICSYQISAGWTLPEAEMRAADWHNGTKIAFALASFKSQHGSYPTTLRELVPAHIAELPKDSAGTNFVYRRQGPAYMLASAGPDRVYDKWDDQVLYEPESTLE